MATEKTLQGIVRITEVGDINLSLPPKPIGTALPNALDNQVIEEVYIITETEGVSDIHIYLPFISTFNSAWNTKIYIYQKGKNTVYLHTSTTFETEVNYINGENYVQLLGYNYVHIIGEDMYGLWTASN